MFRNYPLDFSVVPYRKLPGKEYTVLVSQVDADGNDIAGIRLPELTVPLGTHLGWSVLKPNAGFPDSCGQHGSFIPFAKTRTERLAAGDPRPSLEERYGDARKYVEQMEAAASDLMDKGLLLEEDRARIVYRAKAYGFTFWQAPPR
jgi:hypothetical protein